MEIQLVDARNCEILEERELLIKQMRDWAMGEETTENLLRASSMEPETVKSWRKGSC